ANELVIWRVESPGPEYDDVLLSVLPRSGHCRDRDQNSQFGQLALLLQEMPLESRQAMLAAERALLARWGGERAGLPDRPMPSLREREERVLAAAQGRGDAL